MGVTVGPWAPGQGGKEGHSPYTVAVPPHGCPVNPAPPGDTSVLSTPGNSLTSGDWSLDVTFPSFFPFG